MTFHGLKIYMECFGNKELRNNLTLNFEILEGKVSIPSGVSILKLNNDDGTIKYGTFTLPVYKYPLQDTENTSNNEYLNYDLAVILNEPREQAPQIKIPDPMVKPQPFAKREEGKEESKDEVPQPSKDDKDENKDQNSDPFIPNNLRQFTDKRFDINEVIILYVDSARFLPENISVPKITLRILSDSGSVIFPESTANCIIDISTAQKPFFGLREEISKKKHPNLNPSAVCIIRIETIDRIQGFQRVVGYSFFPLFIDRASLFPAK
jgi:hypothetical protein